jgi:hypothetical protein
VANGVAEASWLR